MIFRRALRLQDAERSLLLTNLSHFKFETKHHWITLCHVSSDFQRTMNSPASSRIIRPVSECGVTSVGLVLVFTVSVKCPFWTSHVPVLRYVFVRSGWLNHSSLTKLPSAATVFVHRILSGIPTPRGSSSSARNQTPANCWRKSLSNPAILTCCQRNNRHTATMTTNNPIIVSFFMARNVAWAMSSRFLFPWGMGLHRNRNVFPPVNCC